MNFNKPNSWSHNYDVYFCTPNVSRDVIGKWNMPLRAITEFIDTGIHILVDKSIKDTEKGIYILLYLYREITSVF